MNRRCKCIKCGFIQEINFSEDGFIPENCVSCNKLINNIETSYKHRMDVIV